MKPGRSACSLQPASVRVAYETLSRSEGRLRGATRVGQGPLESRESGSRGTVDVVLEWKFSDSGSRVHVDELPPVYVDEPAADAHHSPTRSPQSVSGRRCGRVVVPLRLSSGRVGKVWLIWSGSLTKGCLVKIFFPSSAGVGGRNGEIVNGMWLATCRAACCTFWHSRNALPFERSVELQRAGPNRERRRLARISQRGRAAGPQRSESRGKTRAVALSSPAPRRCSGLRPLALCTWPRRVCRRNDPLRPPYRLRGRRSSTPILRAA